MENTTKRIWGLELIINCSSANLNKIKDEQHIRRFIKVLVKEIDMVAWGEPLIQHFQTPEPEKTGWSFCQMITTSAITGHFVDDTGDIYMNLFSCKTFKKEDVIRIVQEFFEPSKIKVELIERSV